MRYIGKLISGNIDTPPVLYYELLIELERPYTAKLRAYFDGSIMEWGGLPITFKDGWYHLPDCVMESRSHLVLMMVTSVWNIFGVEKEAIHPIITEDRSLRPGDSITITGAKVKLDFP